MNKMPKNILITGYMGFIGSHLISFLEKKGYNIIKLEQDIRNDIKFDGKVDVVVHLAALIKNIYPEKELNEVNVKGTLNVLEFCKKNKVKLVYSSSVAVYGDKNALIKESDNCNPVTIYGKTKLEAERLCKKYSDLYGIKCVILRFANIYGTGQKTGFLISDILEGLKYNKNINLNNPNIRRDFVYIDDALDSILKAINFEKEDFSIFNISYGKSISIGEIVDTIAKVSGRKLDVTYRSSNKDTLLDLYYDISRTKKILKWKPNFSFEQGIKDILR